MKGTIVKNKEMKGQNCFVVIREKMINGKEYLMGFDKDGRECSCEREKAQTVGKTRYLKKLSMILDTHDTLNK